MSDSVLVQYEVKDKIAILTLDDAPANTYTHEMMCQIDLCVVKARFDKSVEVIVITGAGEKFFCAGANIGMLSKADPDWKYSFCLHANETLNRLEQTPKLVIAALNGHTVGGGLEIAMAADIRIARKDSGKVGLPEVALGVLPGTGGTQRLVRLVGKPVAIQMMCEGSTFGFDVAAKHGLVNEIYDNEDRASFLAAVLEYASQFTTPNKATKAVGLIKRSVQTGAELPFELALALERELQAQLFSSSDAKEGLNAYIEKRKAVFEGK
jgi:enoyl-CoA hydratase